MARKKLSRREILKLGFWGTVHSLISGVVVLEYSFQIEPDWLDINPVDLTLPRLPKAFDGYQIAQISDIHHDEWMNQERLSKVVDEVNQLKPDTIVITGDFVTGFLEDHKTALAAELSRLSPKQITLAVLGNHDHWTDASMVRDILDSSGITELRNQIFTLKRDDSLLHICGVDDFWVNEADLDHVITKLPNEGCAILLCHEPDFADISAATGRFDLQLSGHSHGGQVIFPIVGPTVLPDYANKYPVGLYQVGSMLQYTNRGVGMIPPYVRFNCRPEITLFTLHAAT